MDYQLKLVTATAPAAEPLVVGGGDKALDILTHINEADGTDPATIAQLQALIKTGRRWAENYLSRCLIYQTYDLLLTGWPWSAQSMLSCSEIRIPRAPLKAWDATVNHVKYLDSNGAQQTLTYQTDYVVSAESEPAFIVPAYGKSWPSVRNWLDASGNYPVEVRFTAGYGATGKDVPEMFRQAIALLVYHWYRNREALDAGVGGRLDVLPAYGVDGMLSQERFSPW